MLPDQRKVASYAPQNKFIIKDPFLEKNQQAFMQWLQRLEAMEIPSSTAFRNNKTAYINWSIELKEINGFSLLVAHLREYAQSESSLFPNSVIFNQVIQKLGLYGQLSLAYETLQLVNKCCLVDVFSYNILINAAGKNNNLTLAKAVFQEAKDKGIDLNVISYNSLIDAAGKNNDLSLAKVVFQETKDKGIDLNVISYNSLIDAAGKNNDLSLARAVFQEARDKDIDLDVISYNSLINAAGKNKNLALAMDIFQQAKKKGDRPECG